MPDLEKPMGHLYKRLTEVSGVLASVELVEAASRADDPKARAMNVFFGGIMREEKEAANEEAEAIVAALRILAEHHEPPEPKFKPTVVAEK